MCAEIPPADGMLLFSKEEMGSNVFYFVSTEEVFDDANKIHVEVSLPMIQLKYPFSLGHVYSRLDFKLI